MHVRFGAVPRISELGNCGPSLNALANSNPDAALPQVAQCYVLAAEEILHHHLISSQRAPSGGDAAGLGQRVTNGGQPAEGVVIFGVVVRQNHRAGHG